jgi:hypothetical protein
LLLISESGINSSLRKLLHSSKCSSAPQVSDFQICIFPNSAPGLQVLSIPKQSLLLNLFIQTQIFAELMTMVLFLCFANESSFRSKDYCWLASVAELKNNPHHIAYKMCFPEKMPAGLRNANGRVIQWPPILTKENCHLHLHFRSLVAANKSVAHSNQKPSTH